MKRRSRRRVALLLMALLAFAQANVSFASCPMERGMLGQWMAQSDDVPCEMETHVKADGPKHANRCLAHCTADLQLAGLPVVLVQSPTDHPVLLVSAPAAALPHDTGLEATPPGTPPPRVLLHSFLI